MTTAFEKKGFRGDYEGTCFITQVVRSAKARELYLLSERVNAEEALQLGLTSWVCEPEALLDECLDLQAAHHVYRGHTPDHKEAAKAFVEKRKPVLKSR